jgi:tyrosyl-tRNA synthetase
VLFGKGEFTKMAQADKELLKAELPTASVDENKLAAILVTTGLATSTTEARRFVESGAVSVNGIKVVDSLAELPTGDNLIKRGKNNFAVATVA